MLSHFRMFAAYNAWANRRLYAACAQAPEADFHRDGGAFFGSLCGTLNHILVTDRIWMARFEGKSADATPLDAILHDTLYALGLARAVEDRRIAGWVRRLTSDDLRATITYTRQTAPERIVQPLSHALAHLFNHQTHHRGQAHAVLTQFAGPFAAPPLDLAFFQRGIGVE